MSISQDQIVFSDDEPALKAICSCFMHPTIIGGSLENYFDVKLFCILKRTIKINSNTYLLNERLTMSYMLDMITFGE